MVLSLIGSSHFHSSSAGFESIPYRLLSSPFHFISVLFCSITSPLNSFRIGSCPCLLKSDPSRLLSLRFLFMSSPIHFKSYPFYSISFQVNSRHLRFLSCLVVSMSYPLCSLSNRFLSFPNRVHSNLFPFLSNPFYFGSGPLVSCSGLIISYPFQLGSAQISAVPCLVISIPFVSSLFHFLPGECPESASPPVPKAGSSPKLQAIPDRVGGDRGQLALGVGLLQHHHLKRPGDGRQELLRGGQGNPVALERGGAERALERAVGDGMGAVRSQDIDPPWIDEQEQVNRFLVAPLGELAIAKFDQGFDPALESAPYLVVPPKDPGIVLGKDACAFLQIQHGFSKGCFLVGVGDWSFGDFEVLEQFLVAGAKSQARLVGGDLDFECFGFHGLSGFELSILSMPQQRESWYPLFTIYRR